jgi:selenoprotein W-related protein
LAAAIKEAKNVEAELISSGGGVFDVVVDGKKIYSKHDTGRFPTNEEVLELLT